MNDVFVQRDALLAELASLKQKATHAHKLACQAVHKARRHFLDAQSLLDAAENTMRATAKAADAEVI